MFGYIRVLKDELKIKEYNVFRAYYCGLCKTLKTEYGFFARMGLNYDSVFLSLLLSSVIGDKAIACGERCMANPIKKRPVMQKNQSLSYSAGVMMILAMLKLKDNIRDEKSVKAMITYALLWRARRKLMKRYGDLYQKCNEHINTLSGLETAKCTSVDEAAHAFAKVTETVFVPDFIEEESTRRILSHMGYLLGRVIYLFDAFEDKEQDQKNGSYNPYLLAESVPSGEEFENAITFTLSAIASDYELLTLRYNKPILDNIIYLGLPDTLKRVAHGMPLREKGERKHERSL